MHVNFTKEPERKPVFRFAPSPNGRLHLGHAYSALLNAKLARQAGGRFLLRIEDIDTTRCTPELADACKEDLAWLGLRWEEPVRVQSGHWDDYAQALEIVSERGLLYPCFCTRREIGEAETGRDPDGAPLYPGTCRALSAPDAAKRMAAGEPYCLRLRMEEALRQAGTTIAYRRFSPAGGPPETVDAQPGRWGDVVLRRKEIPTSYHLSVVVDDALQGVTHVVRGADLEAATCVHALLQTLLGLPSPLYYHHALLTGAAGEKLSKSTHSTPLCEWRAGGFSPGDIRQMLPPDAR